MVSPFDGRSLPGRPDKRTIRLVLLALLVLSAIGVGSGWATRNPTLSAPEGDGVTVVSKQGRDYFNDSARMIAFGPDGEKLFEHRRFDTYFDVDPVEGTERTVLYVGVQYVPPSYCPDDYHQQWPDRFCSRQHVLRTNLSTGETTTVYTTVLPRLHKLHDVDRVNDTTLVVADIYRNEVQFVDTRTGNVTWRWSANRTFDHPESGGSAGDWTHINDVEMVRDGLVMASLRNHDQTVFLRPGEGLVENLTLGCDDCHDVLYEHHNADYMPGGPDEPPTVIVADSENDRVVEFQRQDGEWVETWTWTAAEMHWPRDADRLPNGNTLVTDSNANRVVEIAPNGSIVWSVTVGNPYEAERLWSGDESTGGSAHAPGHQVGASGPVDHAVIAFRTVLPSKPVSGALFMLPYWAGFRELVAVVLGALAGLTWLGLETRWLVARRDWTGVRGRLGLETEDAD